MNGRRWRNEEIVLLKKLIHEGKSTQEISSTLNRSESATKNKIYDLNISLNKCKNRNKHKYKKGEIVNNIKTSSKYDVQKIIRMYKDGLSAYKISDKLNISPNVIYNILKRNGVNRRTKNSK